MAETIKQKVLYDLQVNGVDKASTDTTGLSNSLGGLSGIAGTIPPQLLAIGAASVAAVAGLVVLTKAAIDNTNAMSEQGAALFNSASAANVTIEEYQSLNYVLRQTTGQLDGAGNSLRMINTFMIAAESPTSRQAQVLDDLNLSYADLIAMDPAERFNVLADSVGNLTDETEQNLAASKIFGGRYSTQIIAALNQTDGSMRGMMDTFRESNLILSDESVEAMKSYDDAITDFQMGMDVLKGDLAVGMIPILKTLLGGFQDILPVLRDGVAEVLPLVTDRGLELVEWGMEAIPMVIDLIEGFVEFTGDVEDLYESLEPTLKGLSDLVGWFISVDESLRDIAFKPLTDGLADTFVALKKIIDFAEAHETTTRVAMAIISTGASEISRAMDDATASSEALERAEERRAEANREVLDTVKEMYAAQVLSNEATRQAERDLHRVTIEVGELSGKTDALTQEMIDLEIVEIKVAWAALAVNAAMKGMTPAIEAQMESLRVYRSELDELGTGLSGAAVGIGGIAPTEPAVRPTVGTTDPMMAVLGISTSQYMEASQQVLEMRVNTETEIADLTLSIQQDWLEQYYDVYMNFAGDIVDTFVDSWEDGMGDLDDLFGDLLEKWAKDLAKSAILTGLSAAVGGGPVGLFGQLLGGGGK